MHSIFTNDNLGLIKKYETKRIPYYTSYPTGGQWLNNFNHSRFVDSLRKSANPGDKVPMALYIHFPFCKQLCFYCCCIKIITNNRDNISRYMGYLHKEIDLFLNICEHAGIEPDIREIHLGGGTPTYMTRNEFSLLIDKFSTFVNLKSLSEFVLEIDPRTVDKDDVHFYLDKGINRISFGIQDFDANVQQAINRIQPVELIEPLLSSDVRPKSVNFDLIYGLPFSTRQSFNNTIEIVKQLNPDRLAIYNYDHTPDIHSNMRAISTANLPDLEQKTLMYFDSVVNLLSAGYEYVGIDHFAKSSDSLAKAYRENTIWRNLNGYTVDRDYNFEIGLGMSSISAYSNYYSQNRKQLPDYYNSLDNHHFPVLRGIELNNDDCIRRDVILTLLCRHRLNFVEIEIKFSIDFREYFCSELEMMQESVDDGLSVITETSIIITEFGKMFAHHVCKYFDIYFSSKEEYIRTHAAIKQQTTLDAPVFKPSRF